nr:lysine histidine transporter-like 7 [Quercus suber]
MGERVYYRQVTALPPSSPNAIFPAELLQMTTIIDSDPSKSTKATNFQGCQPNPQEDWLPITESRNGSTFSATFHLLCSGIGLQALLLPIAFASLGWAWGIICLPLAFVWQLYTIFILVGLHEPVYGIRYSRYLQLAKVSFGSKLGKFLAKFPLMYTSGGTCILLIINGGEILDLLFKTTCENEATCHVKPLSSTEGFLVFTCMAILIAQLPNLNSMTKVSLIGATTAIGYCTLILVLSITKGRPTGISYYQSDAMKSNMIKFIDTLNALAIIALAFRGHNVILEIQVPFNGGLLSAYSQIHGANTSKLMMGLIYLLVLVNRLCTFQVYAMPVFDNMEMRYITKKKKPCSKCVRTCLRILFGGLTFLAALALPFFGSLTLLLGGIALPLTYAYPCFMWIAMKKPRPNRVVWSINLVLGCFGIVFCVLIVIAAAWTLSDKGLKANFFKP